MPDEGAAPWLVVGDLVDTRRLLRRGNAGGTIVRTWDPPSAQDLDAYLEAVGVARGIDPMFSAAAETLLAEFRARLEAVDSKRMPEIFDLSEANARAARAADNSAGLGLGRLLRAVGALLRDREQAETQFLDGVDRLLEEFGFAPDERTRAIRKSFEDARWRARGAQMAHMVDSARCDLGLVAVVICGGSSSSTLAGARAAIQAQRRMACAHRGTIVRTAAHGIPRGSAASTLSERPGHRHPRARRDP